MALRTRYVGSGLGLKPIAIGEDPYKADSDFDSTVRIPVTTTKKAPSVPASVSAAPTITQPPVQPQVQPQVQQPMTPATPPTIGQTPGALDPTKLNYQGSTFDPGVPATTTTSSVDQAAADALLRELEGFIGDLGRFPTDWRQKSPDELLAIAKQRVDTLKQYGTPDQHADTDFRQRLDDWYAKFEATIKKTANPNPEYQIRYLQQQLFNSAVDRLKVSGSQGAREQDEELMAMLASRGLLDSGIAAREITKLQEARNQNYYDAVNQLNQMLLQGDISRLTARDFATLEADLQKRNQEALLRLQQKFAEANQPSGIAQIIGTAAGTALPFLLGGGGSSGTNAAPSTTRLYGEQPGSTYRRPPESIL